MSESDPEHWSKDLPAPSEIDWSLFDVVHPDDWQQEEATVVTKSTEIDWSVFFPSETTVEEEP